MADPNRKCRHLIRAVLVTCLLVSGLPATGQEDDTATGAEGAAGAGPDTSEWRCGNCPFPYGLSGDIAFGLGYVSDGTDEFGDYRGLEDDGFFPALGMDLLYRTDDARYLDVYGERLGLDSRTLSLEGGRQGSYSVWLDFDGISHVRADDARSVFLGAGTEDQALTDDWVFADNTGAMTRLDSSLRNVEIGTERETLRLGFEVEKVVPWRYRLDVERTTREGSLIKGGSFVFRAMELAAPVDHETTNVEAAVGYVRDSWELEAAYNLSVFDNGHEFLRWQNAFTPINGASRGELAESPDNQSHQLMLSGSWRLPRWLAVAGQVAIGKVEQDEPFLAPTLNPGLVVPGLPRADLEGEVSTRVANLRVTGNITDSLGAKVGLKYDERDNETPRDPFFQVITDAFAIGERTNEPFSYERKGADLALDYRVFSALKLSATAEHEKTERTFQEVEDTDTDTYSLQARSTPTDKLNLNLKLSREERDNDLDPILLGPTVNPSLRRFHYADKEREALRFNADYALRQNLVLGLFAEVADEEFSDTRIGLSDARDESYGLDLSAIISKHVNAYGFVAVESLDADISGADILDPGNISGVRWRAEQNDDFRTLGFGVEFGDLPGKWVRAAVDFTYAAADGEILVEKRSAAPAFPELRTRRYTLEASVERMLTEKLDLRLRYLVGRLPEDDFYRDNVGAATVPNLLSLGEGTSDETVSVISAMLRYNF